MGAAVRVVEAKRLLTKASGFAGTGMYTHTLNPYAGCAFACRYCYMRTFPVQQYREEPWGAWVDAKANAPERYLDEVRRLRKRARPILLFMSSATDPYQPLERSLRLTRALLRAMLDLPPDHLTVQTRSPFVAEDLPLLSRLAQRTSVRVSMTVETDRDDIRRLFAPSAPSIPRRIAALRTMHDAGIETQAAISPMLPCTAAFPDMLVGVCDRIVIDTLRVGDGARGRRSAELGMPDLFARHGLGAWYAADLHIRAARLFSTRFPTEAIHTAAGDY